MIEASTNALKGTKESKLLRKEKDKENTDKLKLNKLFAAPIYSCMCP
jgi:hypothetical protein